MRVLIFGTCYVKTPDDFTLIQQWIHLHGDLNPTCDLLLVDSCSPYHDALQSLVNATDGVHLLNFADNIGHLGRNGEDGWGRAFCAGLEYAQENYYDYVVHIEGDSLFRRPVVRLCEFMCQHGLDTFIRGVNGTKFKEFAWVETGIMFLSVPYVQNSRFIERYDWKDGKSKKYPNTPELVVYKMLDQDCAINIAPINVMRDDTGVLTMDNVRNYDWITHTTPEIFAAFVTNSMVTA